MAKEKHYIIENEELMKEWDWEKNREEGLEPEKITEGNSRLKINWIGKKCGHIWQAVSFSRTNKKHPSGCPYCTGQKILAGFNDLTTTNPELIKEWNYTENNIQPTAVMQSSKEEVSWICEKGHKWTQRIVYRTKKGANCPYCSNRKVLKGFNDLSTVCPNIAASWHSIKNKKMPDSVPYTSSERVWWECDTCGGEWQTSIYNRTRKNNPTGCPYCANQKILQGVNDLNTTDPDLCKEWDFEANSPITTTQVSRGCNKSYWWICSMCGNKWKTKVSNRAIKHTSCPSCQKEKKTSFPEQCIYYYIKKYFPDTINNYKAPEIGITELDIYIPSLNVGIEYDGYYYHNKKQNIKRDNKKDVACRKNNIKLYRIQEIQDKNVILRQVGNIFQYYYGNEKALENIISIILNELNINNIEISINKDRQNIYSQYIINKKQNSLSIKYPKIAAEWNYKRNGSLTPEAVSHSSNKKVWWICKLGHEWAVRISTRTYMNSGCPYCSGQKTLSGFNDLATKYPNLLKEWDYDKNNDIIAPEKVSCFSPTKVYWRCEKGHSYKTSIGSRTNMNSGCPYCSGRMPIVGQTDLKTLYPDIAKQWSITNKVKPTEVGFGSSVKVGFECENCGKKFKRIVSVAVKSYKANNKVLCLQCAQLEAWVRRKNKNKNDK